jgi:hypothetical protein
MAAYLADVRDTLPLHVTVIANTRNLGFLLRSTGGWSARGANTS